MNVSRADLTSDVLASAFESLPDAVAVVDVDGGLLLQNRRCRDLLRSCDGELTELGFPHAPAEAHLHDGRIIHPEATPMRDADGTLVARLWTFRDVTAQRQEQLRDRHAARRLALLERLEQAARALDRALTPNQVLVAILREGLQALGAQTGYVGLLNDDGSALDVRRIDAETGRVEELGRVSTDEPLPIAESARNGTMLLIGDNEQLRCEHPRLRRLLEDDHACASLPLRADGRVGAVLNIGFDKPRAFDERDHELYSLLADRASSALDRALLNQELEHRASASYALEHVGDGVFLIDEQGRVRLWNPAAVAVTQVPEARAVGAHVSEVIPGWSELSSAIPVQDHAGGTASSTMTATVSMRRPDGSCVLVDIGAVSGPSGCVYAFRDVTDAQRLERAKRDFVATVSHELRTPVTSIMGGAMTLQRRDLQLDESVRDTLLDTIVAESQRLAAIAGQVLLAARLDTEPAASRVSTVQIAPLIDAAHDAAVTRHPDRDVQRDVRTDTVDADPGQLRQVLDNLIDNAIKYSPLGEPVVVSATREDAHVAIRVTDRGIGISHHDQRHVFEMFFRADASMSRGVGGAGLGLHIARQFVTAMGGSIHVRSEGHGQGSTFTVLLPTRDEQGAMGSNRPSRDVE